MAEPQLVEDAEGRITLESAAQRVLKARDADPNYPKYSQQMYHAMHELEEALGLRPPFKERFSG